MRIFNEDKTQVLENPDLEKGYLKTDVLVTHHDAQPEIKQQVHYELIEEYPNGGKAYDEIIDVPYQAAREAYDEKELVYVYIPYTEQQIIDIKNSELNAKYIPSENVSLKLFAKTYFKANPLQDTEEKLMLSGLYDTFDSKNPQKREVGDLVNYAGQTYECIQVHDEAVYPDINPNNPQTWHTFYKPLHGKSKETARLWKKPQYGTTDMYLNGEYMVYTDGKIYKCLSDTVYSPDEYTAAWEVQE